MRAWWLIAAYVLAPSVLVMAVVTIQQYRRAHGGRVPHVFLMACSYVLLVVVAVAGYGGWLPRGWLLGLLCMALALGFKGLLLVAVKTHGIDMAWWPEREAIRWLLRRGKEAR